MKRKSEPNQSATFSTLYPQTTEWVQDYGWIETGNKPENVLQVRKQYCTGKRHLLLDNIWVGHSREMSYKLRELQIPHTFC